MSEAEAAPEGSAALQSVGSVTDAVRNPINASSGGGPPYIPQFSTATSLILERIRNGSTGLDSALSDVSTSIIQPDRAAYEDAKSRLVQIMNTTLSISTPAASITGNTLPLAASPATETFHSFSSGVKRKRDSPSEKVDFTQNTVSFPWVEKRDSPAKLDSQTKTIADDEAHKQDEVSRLRKKSHPLRQEDREKLREERLASLPTGVVPARPELVGFSAGRASDFARTEYFYGMKKTDLLNILSFCDQLKPQILIDVMVSITKKHPDLPVFDSPDWESQVPSALRSTSNPTGGGTRGDQRSRYGPSLINSKAKNRLKKTKKILKRTRVIEVVTDVPDGEEDVLPPTWPKANEGMYAKLPPETEDREFLLDENDEESFSQFMVDGFGKQIVEPVSVA
ncbi:Fc.00g064790.m01.CDS01 [Cosmosporella sp. VM-42]